MVIGPHTPFVVEGIRRAWRRTVPRTVLSAYGKSPFLPMTARVSRCRLGTMKADEVGRGVENGEAPVPRPQATSLYRRPSKS